MRKLEWVRICAKSLWKSRLLKMVIFNQNSMHWCVLKCFSNYAHYKVWDEIIHPFPNFNGATTTLLNDYNWKAPVCIQTLLVRVTRIEYNEIWIYIINICSNETWIRCLLATFTLATLEPQLATLFMSKPQWDMHLSGRSRLKTWCSSGNFKHIPRVANFL